MATPLRREPHAETRIEESQAGAAALRTVRRSLLARAAERPRLRLEDIPAAWPMTRHRVRRLGEQLIAEGLLERDPDDLVRITALGRRALLAPEPR